MLFSVIYSFIVGFIAKFTGLVRNPTDAVIFTIFYIEGIILAQAATSYLN